MPIIAGVKAPQFCLNSQISIDNYDTAPLKVRQRTGFLDKVLSSTNNADWKEIDTQVLGGKPRSTGTNTGQAVEITMEYSNAFCGGGTTPGSPTAPCAGTGATTEQKSYLHVNIDKFVERSFNVDLTDVDALCQSPSDRIADQIARHAYDMRREINEDGIDDFHAALSTYPVSGDAITHPDVQVVRVIDANGNILNAGYSKIKGTFRHALWAGGTQIVGGQTVGTYFDVRMLQGMSQNRGDNLVDPFANSEFAWDIALDARVRTLETGEDADASYIYAWADGAFGMVDWYENTAYKNYIFEDHVRDTITVGGMTFDYFVHFNKCTTPGWEVIMRKYYAWMYIPDAAYCNSQGLRFMFLADQGTLMAGELNPA